MTAKPIQGGEKNGEKKPKPERKKRSLKSSNTAKAATGGKSRTQPGAESGTKTASKLTKPPKAEVTAAAAAIPIRLAKRPPRTAEEIDNGITASDITRMARRAGVVRMSRDIYAKTRRSMRKFLAEIVKDTILYMDTMRRENEPGGTVSAKHVTAALRKNNQTVWGFD